MKKIIILKYGELTLKKSNKNTFLKALKKNIDNSLENIEHEVIYDFGRMFILAKEELLDKIIIKLKNIFGIYEIIIGYLDENKDIEQIKINILNLLKDKEFSTFKVLTKRSDKTYPILSMDINKIIATNILKEMNQVKVDIHHPELEVNIEIRKNEVLYYGDRIKGLGGYPVGTLGKGLLMLSGGIDSPVAGFMSIKRGIKIEAIYFESPPHTSEQAKNKVIKLAQKLAKYNGNVKLYVVNFTEIQETLLKNVDHDYLITLMRRMMYRISAIIASRHNDLVLINGESVGQVASQTLSSMRAINEVVKMPVIRPLACFDKLEIINIARNIDTYETSILPYEDCCTIFVPKHPIINPNRSKCTSLEEKIPWQDLIYQAVKNVKVINITEENNNDYLDIL